MQKTKNSSKQNTRKSTSNCKSIKHFSSKSLLKPVMKRLQCDSQRDSAMKSQPKKIQLDQRKKLSSYTAFMKKIKNENRGDIPSCFSLIKIQDNKKNGLVQEDFQNINFSILKHSCAYLMQASCEIISKFGISDICGKYALNKLIKQIFNGYNVLSYHNFSHAFSVLHMYYQLIKMDRKFKLMFSKQEIGFTLIAALAHDLNHKGTNNNFQVKIGSQLAKTANNESVLQKMHVRQFFNIVRCKGITIIQKSKNPTKIKQLITRAILSTDVAKHFKGLQLLKSFRQYHQFDPKISQHKYFALQQVFHACDIGNPCLDYQQYINWASLLMYQFQYQTLQQEKNKVQITQFFKYKGKKQFFQGQISFTSNLVFPIWKQLSILWTGFTPLVKNIQKNIQKLKLQMEKQQK